ncbi:hypothetical protein FJZ48_00300 [Candidatus Uhrbacteria bacterium]|nr:hypothetical protein [Candidatus Uhrbacteria bacterium]
MLRPLEERMDHLTDAACLALIAPALCAVCVLVEFVGLAINPSLVRLVNHVWTWEHSLPNVAPEQQLTQWNIWAWLFTGLSFILEICLLRFTLSWEDLFLFVPMILLATLCSLFAIVAHRIAYRWQRMLQKP